MGNKQTNILPINDTCPISLNQIDNGITLECRHQYSILSIQRYCLDYLIKNKNIHCPICKKNINSKFIKNIFKNWIILKNIYDNWNQNNILFHKKINLKYRDISIIKNTDDTKIIIPLFYFNGFKQSCIIKSPLLSDLKIVNSIFLNKRINSNKKTIYHEEIDKFKLCIKAKFFYFGDNYYFYKLIKNIISNKKLKKLNVNFNNLIRNDIYFYIDNQKNVITYDKIEGIMEKNFFLKFSECKILFSTYIFINESKSYLINKIHSIIYY